jgi:hypothetical protein
MIKGEHRTEYEQRERGEDDGEYRIGKKIFDAFMIADALCKVAGEFGIEETDGQAHELGQKIGNDLHINPAAHVYQYHGTDVFYPYHTGDENELCDEDEIYKIDLPVADAIVNNRLCEYGEY